MFYDRGQHHEFVSVVKELEPPQGELTKDMTYSFEFAGVDKQYVLSVPFLLLLCVLEYSAANRTSRRTPD